MNRSFMRPALLLALALGLSACGGKATFPINVTIDTSQNDGLVYTPLVLTDAISGQKLTIDRTGTNTHTFANTLEYGTEYNVTVTGQPPQQNCQVSGGADTAGRRASIDIIVLCNVNRFAVSGAVTIPTGGTGNITGLQVVNGSEQALPLDIVPATPAYTFPNVKFDAAFSLTIFRQPTDGTVCTLKTTKAPANTQLTPTTATFRMPNEAVTVDISCAKP